MCRRTMFLTLPGVGLSRMCCAPPDVVGAAAKSNFPLPGNHNWIRGVPGRVASDDYRPVRSLMRCLTAFIAVLNLTYVDQFGMLQQLQGLQYRRALPEFCGQLRRRHIGSSSVM